MDEIENPIQESTTSLESLGKKETQGAKERETWSGKFDFFLSALGYAVGVGAVWRFPYLCYRNGGGVFLIPYFIFMALVGIPLVFLELGVGQFMSSGPLTCWKSVPIFRGIGLSMNVVNFITNLYYNMIMAYSLYYIVISLRAQLPWQFCDPSWRSPNCVDDYRPEHFNFTTCENSSFELKCPQNGMCYNLTALDGTVANCSLNSSLLQPFGWFNPQFPSQDFWNNVILKKSSGIDETGSMIWQLLVAMIVAWIIIYAMVVRGIQVSGKLVYITAIFPYVILLILGIRGWTLPGASIGIDFYIRPDLSRLADINVWADAASQIFFTLSVAYGGLNSLASYNSFNANIMRDAVVISISNCFTSIFAGFVVFAFVGYLSHITGQRVDQVIQAGQGLSFVVFPFSVTTLPVAPLWSVLFFLMMLMLGMDTEMTGVETTITSVLDIFPSLRQSRVKKILTITIICLLHFLCGLIFTFNSGTYWIEMLDYYAGNWAVFIVGAIESISIAWFYGLKNFHLDLSIMIGREKIYNKLFYYWDICWLVVSPVLLIILTVLVFIQTTPIQLSDYTFPYWSHILGQCITSLTLAGVFFWAIYTFFDYLFISRKPLINLIKADFEQWKPRKPEDQLLMRRAHGHNSMVMLFKGQDNLAMASTRF